jgi:transcriptional regulator with XRE-family HTH domain
MRHAKTCVLGKYLISTNDADWHIAAIDHIYEHVSREGHHTDVSNIFDRNTESQIYLTSVGENSSTFAQAFGAALGNFLQRRQMSFAEAARQIGLGPEGKARISAYCHDTHSKRPKPNAELLYLLCSRLGFGFEYRGFKITAQELNGYRPKPPDQQFEQLSIAFDGQLNLTQTDGVFSMDVKRPPGRIEVTLSLNSEAQGNRR